ncbi:MAG TPA: hypothetical protein VGK48_18800 [Terriglobia bacterium]|jgi:hypothetical protein
MLRLKNILPVFVALLFLGVASTAFAQVSCNVASTPVSRDSNTGLTEPAGDITFQCTETGAAASTAGATITVSYGVPITNDTTTVPLAPAYNATKLISVVDPNVAGCLNPTSVTVSNASGSVVIQLPAVGTGVAGSTCNYTLTGVLIGLAGSGATSVVATVSVSPGNNLLITAGQNTPTVVTSVLAPIVTAGVVLKTGPAIIPTTGASAAFTQTFTINTTENYIDMFRDKLNAAGGGFNSGAASNGVQLLYTFTGIPTGASLGSAGTPCTASMTNGSTVSITSTAITSIAPTTTVEVSGITAASLTAIDTITLSCTLFSNGTATLPLTPGSITATVTLGPVGTAFSAAGAVLNNPATTGQVPRYTGPTFGPFTVVNIIPLTTHMLFPYVTIGNGFDTGFVVANTTADPYGAKTGGAPALGGPVTIAFYPNNGGAAFCASTGTGAAAVAGITSCSTVTAGTGLTSGAVASGSSWVVLGSQILAGITGAPATFSGYAFAIANFPFAHPTGFVADATFSGKFASGGPALVLTNPAVSGRSGIPTANATWAGTLTESLGH